VARDRQEVTASFLAVVGATCAAFQSALLREHRAAWTMWFPLWVLPTLAGPGARPCSQASCRESCARQAGCAARVRGAAQQPIIKKGEVLSRLTFNPAGTCIRKDKPLRASSASQPLQHWQG